MVNLNLFIVGYCQFMKSLLTHSQGTYFHTLPDTGMIQVPISGKLHITFMDFEVLTILE